MQAFRGWVVDMFNTYSKDGRTIRATDFAYETIYKLQGYRPERHWVIDEGLNFGRLDIPTFTAGDDFGQGFGNSADNSVSVKSKSKSKRK